MASPRAKRRSSAGISASVTATVTVVSSPGSAPALLSAPDLPIEPVPARASVQNLVLARVQVASGLSSPIFLDAPTGDNRLFVVEQPGSED